ncbi:MAG: nuclear transport factor 2 family protein [Elsteraceae bacterium]
MTSELPAVERTLQLYFDGLYECDPAKLAQACRSNLHLYGLIDGAFNDLTYDDWLKRVGDRQSPKDQGHPRHDRIVTIDFADANTCFAKVECALPPRFFVDYLTLLKLDGVWKIVGKTYAAEVRS